MKARKIDGLLTIPSVWAGVGEERKRGLRILPKTGDYFVHVTSRTTGQAFLFGDEEKTVFRKLLRSWAEFSGVGVITYCLMDNHFHVLLWVPRTEEVDHPELLRRLRLVWPKGRFNEWEAFYEAQDAVTRKSLDDALRERMNDLPELMRVLKQSFSCWYNRRSGRKGTLWDSRYRSVVVEGTPLALMSVAAYIDLNPIRAGICGEPMDYRWSGYGEAFGGSKAARLGLELLVRCSRGFLPHGAEQVRQEQLRNEGKDWKGIGSALAEEQQKRAEPKSWKEVQAAYRIWLVHKGETISDPREKRKFRERPGFDPAAVVAEYERQGHVPMSKILLQRTRCFTQGVGLGSAAFLEKLMREFRSCFGAKRKKAARRVKGNSFGFQSLRQVE